MSLGKLLVTKKLVAQEQLDVALSRQKATGGRLEEHLLALGFLSQDQLVAVMQEPPSAPRTIAETGLDTQFLLRAVLKAMVVEGLQTIPELSRQLALAPRIIEEVLQIAKKEALVEIRGASGGDAAVFRYALTGLGRERALEALQQSQYVGPVPVTLADYRSQVQKQSIANERVTSEELARILSHLILAPQVLRQLGPAVNAGKPILLYGPSGNGKTSIAEAIGAAFHQTIYLPHCIEVGNHIIKVFDPVVHEEIAAASRPTNATTSGPSASIDPRWVHCRRPVIIAGGELTLDSLDLKFDLVSHDYEAPLQVKATGGVFVVDDFGRQLVRPADLLNRWIVPLEKRVDYLMLHTGKKFDVPFDELVIFSTNLSPDDMMDAAFLRRVHYKLWIGPPSLADYRRLFARVCETRGMHLSENMLSYIMNIFYSQTKTRAAAFHPKFIVEHVLAACLYKGISPQLDEELVKDALQNLLIVADEHEVAESV
jgi:energy-coupling factor transporter ATP-binding protein EcfA2